MPSSTYAGLIESGKFSVFYLDIALAWSHGQSQFDVFDGYSSTFSYYEQMYTAQGEMRKKLVDLIGNEPFHANVLILERLEILPKFRGRRFGLAILKTMIERFGAGAGIAALKPYPLQFEMDLGPKDVAWKKELDLATFPKNQLRSTKALSKYYGRIGFKQLSRTPFMFV